MGVICLPVAWATWAWLRAENTSINNISNHKTLHLQAYYNNCNNNNNNNDNNILKIIIIIIIIILIIIIMVMYL